MNTSEVHLLGFSTEVLEVPAGGPLIGADILRAFDSLRRRVSLTLRNTEGISVGYDVLEYRFSELDRLAPGTPVTVVGIVMNERPNMHQVEYVARAMGRDEDVFSSQPIAHAQGWTLTPDAANPEATHPRKDILK